MSIRKKIVISKETMLVLRRKLIRDNNMYRIMLPKKLIEPILYNFENREAYVSIFKNIIIVAPTLDQALEVFNILKRAYGSPETSSTDYILPRRGRDIIIGELL